MNETIECPLCSSQTHTHWATENGYNAVTCTSCGLVYVNPRPVASRIDEAVRTGAHRDEIRALKVVGHRMESKVSQYKRILGDMFRDRFSAADPLSWLDIGAGFGEVVEAVTSLASTDSKVEGIEPMKPKVDSARQRGLAVSERMLSQVQDKFEIVSVVNVFSHIPDFRSFLCEVKKILVPGGEIFVETGNIADVGHRDNFPGQLTLPDHLVFAGERHVVSYLEQAGFELIAIDKERVDGVSRFFKNLIKRLIGRPVVVKLPYTSPFRTLLIRARLRNDP